MNTVNSVRAIVASIASIVVFLAPGCVAPRVDFGEIQRPPRSPKLDAYNIFVGSWTWEAEMLNADGADRTWNGTAEWHWTLDKRTLQGVMSAKSERTGFEAAGVWSWHPKSKKYIWGMFNNWGYPQAGTARYDADAKRWQMNYRSVGLDGTTSYGWYRMTVVDNDTLDWSVKEWADPLHLIPKMEMKGTYKRQR